MISNEFIQLVTRLWNEEDKEYFDGLLLSEIAEDMLIFSDELWEYADEHNFDDIEDHIIEVLRFLNVKEPFTP